MPGLRLIEDHQSETFEEYLGSGRLGKEHSMGGKSLSKWLM